MASFQRNPSVSSRVVSLLLAAAALLSACGGEDSPEGVPLQEDAQILVRAEQAIRSGVRVRLRQIAGGDWDRVHVFPGPATREFVESTVGSPIEMPDVYFDDRGGIVVFVRGDVVQRAVVLRPYPFDGNAGSYGPDVTATPPSPTAGWLALSEPDKLALSEPDK